MYVVKMLFCDYDLKDISLKLRLMIRDLERSRIYLYDINVMQDLHGALCPDKLVNHLVEHSSVVLMRSQPVKIPIEAAGKTIRILKTTPHIAVKWYNKALRCWMGVTFYNKVTKQWTSAGVQKVFNNKLHKYSYPKGRLVDSFTKTLETGCTRVKVRFHTTTYQRFVEYENTLGRCREEGSRFCKTLFSLVPVGAVKSLYKGHPIGEEE